MLRYDITLGKLNRTLLNRRGKPNKHFIVDALLTNYNLYLQNRTVLSDFAPFPLERDVEIKISIPALGDTLSIDKDTFTYCVVVPKNDGVALRPYFYFIDDIVRRSNDVVILRMQIDALDTFQTEIKECLADPRTFVMREHCDRFIKNEQNNWIPHIDTIDEGFTLMQYKIYDKRIQLRSNPIDSPNCFLILNSKKIKEKYYTTIERSDDDIAYYDSKSLSIGIVWDVPMRCEFRDPTIQSGNMNLDFCYNVSDPTATPDSNGWFENMRRLIDVWDVPALKDIDTTTESLVKIKALPYPPVPTRYTRYPTVSRDIAVFERNDSSSVYGYHSFPRPTYDLVTVPTGGWGTGNVNEVYAHGIVASFGWYRNVFDSFPWYSINVDELDIANYETYLAHPDYIRQRYVPDPKIYHSNFFTLKYVYGEKSCVIPLEFANYDIRYNDQKLTFNINYKVTYGLSGDFMFHIEPYSNDYEGTYPYLLADTDYFGYVVVSDGSEVSLTNDEYINYMRNGYNYDQQAHANQMTKTIASSLVAIGTATAIGATQGPWGAAVGLVSSSLGAIINTVFTEASYQDSRDKKISELSHQSPQLSDTKNGELLFGVYGNRLRRMEYAPKPEETEKLESLFHLCGYTRNLFKSVDTSTRYWFNYVQCKPHFEGKVPEFVIADLSSQFEEGVTFFHTRGGQTDFEQIYENWEVNLIL